MEHINSYEHPGGSTRSLPPGQQIEDRSICTAWTLPDLLLEFSSEELAELLPELIEAVQADTTEHLEGARSAIAEVDFTRLGNEIHAVKGSAKQLRVDALVAVCMEIESLPHQKTMESMKALLSQLKTHRHDISRAMTSYIESTGLSTPVKE